MHTPRVVRVLTIAFACLCATAQAATIYVSTIGNDAGDGLSWAAAKQTVQAAVNAAQPNDQVWIAAGTYVERVSLKASVALYGGFAGTETDLAQRNWTANLTILDGNHGGRVVTASAGSRVDGFTIRNGQSFSGGGIYCADSVTITNNTITNNTVGEINYPTGSIGYGGGIYCYGPATITNNTITNNRGIGTTMIYDPDFVWIGSDGGGIYCTDSSATITGNTITGNASSGDGAGVYCYGSSMTITNNIIADNSAGTETVGHGGGILCAGSALTLAGNNVTGNTAYFGAGIYCYGPSGKITDNRVADNVGYDGGGVYCSGSLMVAGNAITGNSGTRGGGVHCGYASRNTVANNTIAANIATCTNFRQGGGGIYCNDNTSPTICNNTIMANTAAGDGGIGYGGGIYCDYQSQPAITNNTIAAGNSAPSGGAVFCYCASPSITNSILAFNSSGIARYNGTGTLSLRYNCVFGNTAYNYSNLPDPTGTDGNISRDPRLADVSSRNLHIQPDSPCLNAADPAIVPGPGETDMDGQPRKIGPHVDIGADEFCWAGDINCDSYVNVGDLQLLVAAWGMQKGNPGYNPAADCNSDTYINVGDLQLLVANWGQSL